MSTDDLRALELEAEKRRQEATNKAKSPLPSHIKSIISTTVTYTVDPRVLPFSLIDSEKLLKLFEQKYRLKFKPPNYNLAQLQRLGMDPSSITQEKLLSFLLSVETPQIAFENGRYPTGPNTSVPIELLYFGRETISATVNGITEVAQVIIADALSMFWEATGASQKWDSPEIQEKIQMVSYITVTAVDLGMNAAQILNSKLINFMNENINSGRNYGAKMTKYSQYDSFKPSNSIISSWTFDELVLQVHNFNTLTGLPDTNYVHFDTKTKDERGRGIVTLETTLPFDEHAKFVNELVSLLTEAG